MKTLRYIVGVIGFLLVFFTIAVLVSVAMAFIFPRTGEQLIFAGIGLDWRNIPGTILGTLAGFQSFRASIKVRAKKPTHCPSDKK